MRYLRTRVRESRAALALAILMPLAIALSPATSSSATSAMQPACQASQVVVTAGATLGETNYSMRTPIGLQQRSASLVIPVYFYNRGAICHLLMGAPIFRPVRYTTDAAHLSANDLGVPAGADNNQRPVVKRHQTLKALFVLIRPVGAPFKACKPGTATGVQVGGYVKPVATTHFILRQIRDVCFDTGIGRNVGNYGAAWPAT